MSKIIERIRLELIVGLCLAHYMTRAVGLYAKMFLEICQNRKLSLNESIELLNIITFGDRPGLEMTKELSLSRRWIESSLIKKVKNNV